MGRVVEMGMAAVQGRVVVGSVGRSCRVVALDPVLHPLAGLD